MSSYRRCLQITWTPGSNVAGVWEDCGSAIKLALVNAFDALISQREEEVKRSESQRQMPGWNFCNFFLAKVRIYINNDRDLTLFLKESLASSFDGMGLLDDALLQYDELEASFFQVLKERNLSWFGSLIDPEPTDDSTSIFSLSKKPYHNLVMTNSISVFDCRVCLLAHQCDLLARLGSILDLAKRVQSFLCSFSQTLRQAEVLP